MLARIEDGLVKELRDIEMTDVPEHKRGMWLPVVYEGDGPVTQMMLEETQVRVVRSYPIPLPADVNAERDRRMGTFTFGGKEYDLTGQSLANVSGAGTLSLAALINGAQPGDLRWADPDADFTWIANDNSQTEMDAPTCWAFAQTAAAWRKHCIFRARAIKDMDPIPANFTDDSYWALPIALVAIGVTATPVIGS